MRLKVSLKLFRLIFLGLVTLVIGGLITLNPNSYEEEVRVAGREEGELVEVMLEKLEVKGRAPKTGYDREKFYRGWPKIEGCSLRQRIIKREFGEGAVINGCEVVAGGFVDPYLGVWREFKSKKEISQALQIDHIVALSDAWQKGAQYKSDKIRYLIATDPLNLVAADGPENMKKGDADAAGWLPKNKSFRCQYVGRQVAVKKKYELWVSSAEKEAIKRVLLTCPSYRVKF